MYNYKTQRPNLFTKGGATMLLNIHRKIVELSREKQNKEFCMMDIIHGIYGSSWDMLACFDFLLEVGYIRKTGDPSLKGQYQRFIMVK